MMVPSLEAKRKHNEAKTERNDVDEADFGSQPSGTVAMRCRAGGLCAHRVMQWAGERPITTADAWRGLRSAQEKSGIDFQKRNGRENATQKRSGMTRLC